MKLTFEELMEYTIATDIQLEPISPDTVERICDMTMKKIKQPKCRRHRRSVSLIIAATFLVVLFCGTAFAAYKSGWFDLLLGENSQQLEEHIVVYPPAPSEVLSNTPESEPPEDATNEPSLREGQPLMPSKTYTADTKDHRFTLESMLAGTGVLHAVIRMEPLTDFGRANMGLTIEDTFYPVVGNLTTGGGSLRFELLSSENDCSYYLLTCISANSIGDIAHFEILSILDENGMEYSASLFDVEITDIVATELELTLNAEAHTEEYYNFETMTVTPMSLTLDGWMDHQAWEDSLKRIDSETLVTELEEPHTPIVTITLTDGTVIDCSVPTGYGSYGALTLDMGSNRETDRHSFTCTFSKVIDLDEIAEASVDGISYPLNAD